MPALAWRQIVPALLIGILLGGLIGGRAHLRRGGPPDPERLVSRFSRRLALDADQKTRLREVLETNRRKMDALRGEVRPRFEAMHKDMSAEIRAFLRPDQQEKFDRLEKDWAEKRAKRGFRYH